MSIGLTDDQLLHNDDVIDSAPPFKIELHQELVRLLMVVDAMTHIPGRPVAPAVDDLGNPLNHRYQTLVEIITQFDGHITGGTTLFDIGEPTGETFILKTIEDLWKIPPRRFGAFVAALFSAICISRAVMQVGDQMGMHQLQMIDENGFKWVDDGCPATEVRLRTVDAETGAKTEVVRAFTAEGTVAFQIDRTLEFEPVEPIAPKERVDTINVEPGREGDDALRMYIDAEAPR